MLTVHIGDNLQAMRQLPSDSVDAVITDPPYELAFMGRSWDATGVAFDVGRWRECLRILKPGGHVAAFAHERTYHRTACAVEDAGFEIRSQLLVRPGGTILEPYLGSGSTAVAAEIEGVSTIGIELQPHHAETARERHAAVAAGAYSTDAEGRTAIRSVGARAQLSIF